MKSKITALIFFVGASAMSFADSNSRPVFSDVYSVLVVGANGEDEVVDGTVVVAHELAHRCAAHIYFGVVGVEVYG